MNAVNTSSVQRIIGIFGGTFDPIHNGHLQMAREAQQSLGLNEVCFVPCHQPPHRDTPQLSSEQRLTLLDMALDNQSGFTRNDLELHRQGPSYTVDTLGALRAQYGPRVSLVLLMGADAFAQLLSWHQWQRLRDLAHIAVMTRPGTVLPVVGTLGEWLAKADSVQVVHQQPAGGLTVLQQSLLDISATAIRETLASGQHSADLPSEVAEYIKQYQLYR